MVVFENDILLFSDKHIELPLNGSLQINWARWHRRAVLESAKQLEGAERWIRQYPERVFLDRKCTKPFPFPIPTGCRFHRIVVANGAASACRLHLGGSGSLTLVPHIGVSGQVPFTVGDLDPTAPFVHVLDETSAEIALFEIDTIMDFIRYVTEKERLIRSGMLHSAGGEEELVRVFMLNGTDAGEHYFPMESHKPIVLPHGGYASLLESVTYRLKKEADALSYFWDDLIEHFNRHLIQGTAVAPPTSSFGDQEQANRALARTNRFHRRVLSTVYLAFCHKAENLDVPWCARVCRSERAGEPHFVFLFFEPPGDIDYQEYRRRRQYLLEAYCRCVHLLDDEATVVIGFAREPPKEGRGCSEDLIAYERASFTSSERERTLRDRERFGIMQDMQPSRATMWEFPDDPRIAPGMHL